MSRTTVRWESILATFALALVSFGCLYWLHGLVDWPIRRVLTILSATGGFGGLLYGFLERNRQFEPARRTPDGAFDLGSLADILTGVGSAWSVFFVLAGSVKINGGGSSEDALQNTLRLVGLGVVSGLAGRSILSNLSKKILAQLQEVERKVERAEKKTDTQYWYGLGVTYRLQRSWEDAKYSFRQAIAFDPNYTSAYLGMAGTLRSEAEEAAPADRERLLTAALEHCQKAVTKEPNFAPGYLERAATKARLQHETGEIRLDLQRAVAIDPGIGRFILSERAFDAVRGQSWFREIAGSEERT